jgi:hypothetical protein
VRVCQLKSSIDGIHYWRPYPSSRAIRQEAGIVMDRTQLHAERCLPLEDNVDFVKENDEYFDFFHGLAASPGACCEMCMANEDCSVYTWTQFNGGSCFLKNAESWDFRRVRKAPAADGSPYVRSGVAYKCKSLLQDTDFPGFDLAAVLAPSAGYCCGACLARSNCAGFSWSAFNSGTCWLKTFDMVRNDTFTKAPAVGVVSALA